MLDLQSLVDKITEENKPLPVINLISQETYKKLHKKEYKEIPVAKIERVRQELSKNGLAHLQDTAEEINLPLPKTTLAVDRWLEEKIIESCYAKYLNWIPSIMASPSFEIDILPDKAPKNTGWSKWDGQSWVFASEVTDAVIFTDMESYSENGKQYRPFMATAVDPTEGNIYCWLADLLKPLPEVISYGNTPYLYIGHNSVAYDRRFIKEFYEFGHDKRMLDTMSLYQVTLGMSARQVKIFDKAKQDKLAWTRATCRGNLNDLASYLCGIRLNKDIKDIWVSKRNKPAKGVQGIIDNLDAIFTYCLQDTLATFEIFKKIVPLIDYTYTLNGQNHKSNIYICGQLERSSLRIGNRKPIQPFIEKVREHNSNLLTELHKEITNLFIQQIKSHHKPLISFIRGCITKDLYERIAKSTGFAKWVKEMLPELIKKDEERLRKIDEYSYELSEELLYCGWEDDEEDEGKRRVIKRRTLKKLMLVDYALKYGGLTTRIKPKTTSEWAKQCLKPRDKKIRSLHLSLTGKILPLVLGMKWNGHYLVIQKNTWGIVEEGKFIPLPHPKGKKDVGTPLSKDFAPKVITKEFTSDFIDLKKVYRVADETQLWEKFDKRFEEVFIHDNTWLPEIVPSGTISGRLTGSLAVVLVNVKEPTKDKPVVYNSAGAEMKILFGVNDPDNYVLNAADYSGQESEIFCAHMGAELGWSGLNLYDIIANLGDIHSYVANYLSGKSPIKIERGLAKNMNFANQFMCGKKRLANMIFIALKGAMPMTECLSIAENFQTFTRGEQNFGVYEGGICSLGFNRIKNLAKACGQKCLVSGRKISAPLRAEVCNEEMTTRVNFNIQPTGQTLVDICLMVMRYLAKELGIEYHFAFMIHDQVIFESHKEHSQDVRWMMQIGHLVSKAVMYERLGVQGFPIDKMYFKTIEEDYTLRKAPDGKCVTPTQTEEMLPGKIIDMSECVPSERVLNLLNTRVF